jgi:hypothetical protein
MTYAMSSPLRRRCQKSRSPSFGAGFQRGGCGNRHLRLVKSGYWILSICLSSFAATVFGSDA